MAMNKSKIILPFLGTDSRHLSFEYLLLKLTTRSALISIPSWLPHNRHYTKPEEFTLHLSGCSPNSYHPFVLKGYGVKLLNHDPEFGDLYRVGFKNNLKGHALFHKNEFEMQPTNFTILHLIKDSLILKQGVDVYLNHFIPFLSRLLKMDVHNFSAVKESILLDVQNNVRDKIGQFEKIYNTLSDKDRSQEKLYLYLDLNLLREIIQSEIDTAFLDITFGNPDVLLKGKVANDSYSFRYYTSYLHSIKNLEARLYTNFNTLTHLYTSLVDKI